MQLLLGLTMFLQTQTLKAKRMNVADRLDMHSCFFEKDAGLPLWRRTIAELIGTLLLVLVIVGSGVMSRILAPNPGLALVVVAFATASALAGLIAALGNASGGHFNPLITLLQWLTGERKLSCTLAYILGQITGGVLGALLADGLFGAGIKAAGPSQSVTILALSETVASSGLMIIVFGCVRSGRAASGPFAVAAWLMSAIVATPSTSYANPAVTISALFAVGPVGLTTRLVWFYVPAEIAGALVALIVIAACYPKATQTAVSPDDATGDSHG